jgi:hypothetical protein
MNSITLFLFIGLLRISRSFSFTSRCYLQRNQGRGSSFLLYNEIRLDGFDEDAYDSKDAREPLENDDGEKYFDLLDNRRVTISKWQGKVRVDLREYYEKDNKLLPGKKGLSLSLEQYELFKDLIVSGVIDEWIDKAK